MYYLQRNWATVVSIAQIQKKCLMARIYLSIVEEIVMRAESSAQFAE